MEHRSTLFSKSISYCNSYFIPIIIVRSNINTCSFYGFYQLLKFLQTVSISARCGNCGNCGKGIIYARCANCVNCVFCVYGCGGFGLWNVRRAIARCFFSLSQKFFVPFLSSLRSERSAPEETVHSAREQLIL